LCWLFEAGWKLDRLRDFNRRDWVLCRKKNLRELLSGSINVPLGPPFFLLKNLPWSAMHAFPKEVVE
jgi:hypothetical protein